MKAAAYPLYEKGFDALNPFQEGIFKDCLDKHPGCAVSVPMGSGKTLIALVLGLYNVILYEQPFVVVCSKTLISGWKTEIHKFFGTDLKYQVAHSTTVKKHHDWHVQPDTLCILTTPEFMGKVFAINSIQQHSVDLVPNWALGFHQEFRIPTTPFSTRPVGTCQLYARKWSVVFIDEAQQYTNITTQRCKALIALASHTRFLLSGTIFNEPTTERIMGYFLLLHIGNVPRTLELFKFFPTDAKFPGLAYTQVIREKNEAFELPTLNQVVVEHGMTEEEAKVYCAFRQIMHQTAQRLKELIRGHDAQTRRQFQCYLHVILNYCRQSLVCPLMPLAHIAVQLTSTKKKSELSKTVMAKLHELDLQGWLNDEGSVLSSRLLKVLEILGQHDQERCVIFSCFRCNLPLLGYYIKGRPLFCLESSMSILQRGKLIKEFEGTPRAVLLLTYQLGSEGLNLQCANTVLLVDFWWNAGVTKQAIARVLRMGQTASTVNIYFFTSNTGIEKFLFTRQINKLDQIAELQTGPMQTKRCQLSLDEVCKLCNTHENVAQLTTLKDKL